MLVMLALLLAIVLIRCFVAHGFGVLALIRLQGGPYHLARLVEQRHHGPECYVCLVRYPGPVAHCQVPGTYAVSLVPPL